MQEMLVSAGIGEIITLIIFAFMHTIFDSPLEVVAFWTGTHLVASYASWTLIIIGEEKKSE